MKGICFFFFQSEITLEKRKKRGKTKCQKYNTELGENYCGMRLRSRAECLKPIPRSITTASYVEEHIVD